MSDYWKNRKIEDLNDSIKKSKKRFKNSKISIYISLISIVILSFFYFFVVLKYGNSFDNISTILTIALLGVLSAYDKLNMKKQKNMIKEYKHKLVLLTETPEEKRDRLRKLKFKNINVH